MRTQIIQLETYDNLVSVRDRLSWAKTPRILLIWPQQGDADLRPVDLAVIQRHASKLGAQVGLVTRRERIRRLAIEQGMPVFQSAGAAQREEWPPVQRYKAKRIRSKPDLRAMREQVHQPEARWRSRLVTRILSFTLGVVSVLVLAALIVPEARIVIEPELQRQYVELRVRADPSAASVNVAGVVPSRQVEVVVKGQDTVVSKGGVSVPQKKATGIVEFSNYSGHDRVIPAGTEISTAGDDPLLFVTLEDGNLPGGVGEIIRVPVEAVEMGAEGNLEANTLVVIGSDLGLVVAVTNPEPFIGGLSMGLRGSSDEERQTLYDTVMADLLAQAGEAAARKLKKGDLVFPESLQEVEVLSEIYDPPIGKAGETLTLTLEVRFTVQYASAEDLYTLAQLALAAAAQDDMAPLPDTVTYETLDPPRTSYDGLSTWQMGARQYVYPPVDRMVAISLVQGRRPPVASQKLEAAFALQTPPEVTLMPSFWPWLPVIPYRIEVEIQ
ncbi:MAG: baseplate J/gp47 family protein [Anaerolineales bacterium]|nr:baseplate J/gp47 family protein [Anaerolineales bacterium]